MRVPSIGHVEISSFFFKIELNLSPLFFLSKIPIVFGIDKILT